MVYKSVQNGYFISYRDNIKFNNFQIEMGIRFGLKVIVDNIEEFDPALVPLLRREYLKQGSRIIVQLGEKSLDVNENFQIFFCVKNENKFIPEFAKSSMNEILFSTTKTSLASLVIFLEYIRYVEYII